MIGIGRWAPHCVTAGWFWTVLPDVPHRPVMSRWLLRGQVNVSVRKAVLTAIWRFCPSEAPGQ